VVFWAFHTPKLKTLPTEPKGERSDIFLLAICMKIGLVDLKLEPGDFVLVTSSGVGAFTDSLFF
jgi:hypothetical protein